MAVFRTMLDITRLEWLDAMKLTEAEIPDVVIVEGSWWRQQRTDWRLGYLTDVRELAFPDIFWGRWKGRNVAFCCAYGAARTVEIIHLFGSLGTPLAVQIGTCGGLQSYLKPGDIILPEVASCREGIAQLYGAPDAIIGSTPWIEKARARLDARGHRTYSGLHMTWSSLFAESAQMMEAWHRAGYLSVEMETATTFAVARFFNMQAVSMVVVWDDLTQGRRFLDPLSADELTALNRANQSVYEVALELSEQL